MEPRWPSLDWVACCLGRGKLSPLTKSDVEALALELGTRHFATGATGFKQGAAPANVHIVSRGSIELSRGNGDDRVVFEVLGLGQLQSLDIPAEGLLYPAALEVRGCQLGSLPGQKRG